ncbi:hypothetical protein [Haliangium sp. UPWRP_2]|uniref:hypothetical protein n=1 Tax=Haliangium sp. UPWRP_2 TaxID=1931276 RepID=UPI000D0D1554|nr:hypothetical protein [Haliangium sp. UPWRP_2]PSM30945.1 hypothetical protein BVG81_007920 [Haliangium sp. UPWRP_2]
MRRSRLSELLRPQSAADASHHARRFSLFEDAEGGLQVRDRAFGNERRTRVTLGEETQRALSASSKTATP